MTRLSILIGIGLMLVGAMAYALPAHQELQELIPALVGIVIAMGGIIASADPSLRKHTMHLNALLTLAMLLWSCFKIIPDWTTTESHTRFVADVDIIGLSAVFIYMAIKSFIAARAERERESAETPVTTSQGMKTEKSV